MIFIEYIGSLDVLLFYIPAVWIISNVLCRAEIIACEHPAEAKKLGRKISNFNSTIWNEHKYEIVKKANFLRFSQHTDLNEFLLKTNERVLVEASSVDAIWGIGLSQDDPDAQQPNLWQGENLLGFALMEVRDELKHRQ